MTCDTCNGTGRVQWGAHDMDTSPCIDCVPAPEGSLPAQVIRCQWCGEPIAGGHTSHAHKGCADDELGAYRQAVTNEIEQRRTIAALRAEIAAFDTRVVNTDSVVTEQRERIAALRAEREIDRETIHALYAERDRLVAWIDSTGRDCPSEYTIDEFLAALTTKETTDEA